MRESVSGALAFSQRALKGALIGMGAILPGVSGGVLCVAMGIYRPMMALLAHPMAQIRTRFWFFLPILVGFAVGVLGLSRLVEYLFRASPAPAVWLFVGLIAGTLPGLWKEAGREGRKAKHVAIGIACFAAALGGMLALQGAGSARLAPSVGVWLLCGALWGVGLVVPGLSPSALFIFLGVYQEMAAGIADFSLAVLLPMGAGFLGVVALLSRAVSALMRRAYAAAMHAVLGVALAGAAAIVPIGSAGSWKEALLQGICFLAGLGGALLMEKMNDRIPESGEAT